MKDVKQKTKSEDKPVYTLTVELQAGRRAEFTYNDFELADAHYVQLQASQVVGHLGVRNITRSWKQ